MKIIFGARSLALWIALIFLYFPVLGQERLRGSVTDKETGDPLIGANILLQGSTRGTITDFDGFYELRVDSLPVTIEISYLGYETIERELTTIPDPLDIAMEVSAGVTLAVTEVKAQRISDRQKAAPLTVESMDILAIKETPSDNFYDGLGSLKGVDLTAASLGFKVVNTRGFNSTSPVRSLQIIDGVDNQSPGLNFSLGNFLGVPELDILKVDLIVGASSAFYGPNAFNGVISMKTKDPFIQEGISAQIKAGERNLLEASLRYAQVFRNRKNQPFFAFKINALGLMADDWQANNLSAVDGTLTGPDNPGGYDAVNIYGDEYQLSNDLSRSASNPGLGIFHRKGYREADLVNYDADNFKTNVSLHFRLNPAMDLSSPKLILSSSYSGGTTVYQGDNRFSLKNVQFFQHKLEFSKEEKYFVRFYATHEDAGNSFDPYFTALKLQRLAKSSRTWSIDYINYWGSNINPLIRGIEGFPRITDYIGRPEEFRDAQNQFLSSLTSELFTWHQMAQDFANSANPLEGATDFLEPGTPEFQRAFDDITGRIAFSEGGTKFYDRSALFHGHSEVKFDVIKEDQALPLQITAGASGRLYLPESRGSILLDTMGRNINTYEFGIYAGGRLSSFNKKLTLTASLRMDKHENFGVNLSPAFSAVYKPAANNYLRVSLSSAIRNPTLSDQFLFYNVGPAILIGNIDGFENLITTNSFVDYLNTLSTDQLDYFSVDPIETEKVRTLEFGYRTTLFNSVYIDAEYYFSRYRDFIGYQIGVDATFDTFVRLPRNIQVYRVASNAEDIVNTQGFSIGINYYFSNFSLAGNYSWNKLVSQVDDPIIPAFNTPEHKYNISLNGRELTIAGAQHWGFNIGYKWIEGFLFEGSPQFTGFIPSYGLLNAQINWTWIQANLTFKIGATNILDNRTFQAYGGPEIGRLAYFSVLYEWLKK